MRLLVTSRPRRRTTAVASVLAAAVLATGLGVFHPSHAAADPGTTVYASDSFNRTVAGSWGSADSGGAWSASGSPFNVTPGSGTIAADSSAPANFLTALSVQDVDEVVRVSPPPISSAWVDTGIAVRYSVSAQTFYRLSAFYSSSNNSGNYTVELLSEPNNAALMSNFNTAVPGGTALWFRLEAQGVNPTTLRWKVWQDGSTEPAGWLGITTDSSALLQTSGGAGVTTWDSNGPATVSFSNLTVMSAVNPAPAVTCASGDVACDTFQRTVTSGWGTSDAGGPWSGSGSAYAVSPGYAEMSAGSTASLNTLSAASASDIDVTVKVTPPPVTSSYVDAGVAVRVSASGSYYSLGAYASSTAGGNDNVALKVEPADTAINPNVATSIPGGTPIWLRLVAQGANPTTLRWKIWADGTTQPATWNGTAVDMTAALQSAGSIGVTGYSSSGQAAITFNGLVATPPSPVLASCPAATVDCDTFDRTVSGSWGSADVGGAWSASGSRFAVSPGSATVDADSTSPTAFLSTPIQDVDAVVKVTPPGLGSAFSVTGILVRGSAAGAYKLGVYDAQGNNGGDYSVQLVRTTDNGSIVPDSATSIPGGTPVWLRLQAQGTFPTTLRWRVWADGTPEPTAWIGSTTDAASSLQQAGQVGVVAYQSSGAVPFAFGALWASTLTSPPPPTLVCASGATVCDTYNRSVSGGWGTADSGGAWSIAGTPSNWSVAPVTGSITVSPKGTELGYQSSVSVRDVEILTKVVLPLGPGSANTYAYVLGRASANASSYYRVGILQNTNTSTSFLRVQRSDGTQLRTDQSTGIPSGNGRAVWLRVQFQGAGPTAIRVRAWADGSSEPPMWQFDSTDGTAAMQNAGAVGVRAKNDSGSSAQTFGFLGFQAVTLPASAAPSGVDVDTFGRTVSSGWGIADQGGAWSTAGTGYAVTPGQATIVTNSGTPTNFLGTQSIRDADILAWVTPPPMTSAYVDSGVALRYVAAGGTFYQVSAYYSTANNNGNYTIQLKRKPANTLINPDVNTSIPGGTAIWYRMEAQGVNPTTLRWKVWQDGTPEPSAWMGSATDSTLQMQMPGGVGIECYANSGTPTMVFDQLSATSIS